ncbi:MAG TPA: chromosome segregation protein SMC, partial [Bacillota bacterium]|nr:chromosome segregation protein SMC [Bacillota bacterium]
VYQPAVNHLMGHVILTKTLKDANDIARHVNYRYRIVTLTGDVVNPGGSMAGGAKQRKNQSLFTRDQELKKSNQKVAQYERSIQDYERTLKQEEATIAKLQQTIETEQTTLNEKQQLFNEIDKQYQEIQTTYKVAKENLHLFHVDLDESTKEQRHLRQRQEKLKKELVTIKNDLTTIDEQVNQLTNQQQSLKTHEQTLQTNIHHYEITLAELDERFKNEQEKCHATKEQMKGIEETIHQLQTNLAKLIESKVSETEKEQLRDQITRKRQLIEEETEKIKNLRQSRLEQMQAIEYEERELKEAQKQHEKLVHVLQEKEVAATRFDVALENKLSHLQTEYKMTFERANELYEKTDDIAASKKVVGQMKREIEKLGTVNLGAIDEYERMTERYQFLMEQKTDLDEAKRSLFALIAEMDETMKKRFSTTFDKIKREFTTVFKQLFDGGHAKLQLTDPQNVLDTGIEIVAQPPGKKLQHLGLLSGGERALTAIALLFAILRVRPVPFCVLDEVEAALDEANVVRFAKYLKKHREETQFIVITHRKGTMEEADVLYGVTMQESGVSRLVSVRLEDTTELVKS